ncbi:type 1 glutamine amidotransferase domain-containing protein [Catalinimonas niigatensis]|uniref:type 1 glutamine amidotransferase domain-containing protein n=1 Tax=Catalinimonas niigatensis TaxID=1397264 RepID=UPI00266539B9|nr:type 1 glutamine amidotransferase domain-containing protein [Catalinimonas niigatensis]WPP49871.1 type 1 glutamine amidotransferase domain-containing protein [Catalinimonas niigatensis]
MDNIKNKRIAILVANGFEEVELSEPKKTLEQAGAITKIVSIEKDKVKAWDKTDWGKDYPVDLHINNAKANDFDALVLPGGQLNPDFLRVNQKAVNFVKDFAQQNKLIAAICHGPWTLIEADLVKGKRMTSYPSIKTDLKNAGAEWIDKEVVEDQGIITSRKPDDIPAFNKAIIEAFEHVTA